MTKTRDDDDDVSDSSSSSEEDLVKNSKKDKKEKKKDKKKDKKKKKSKKESWESDSESESSSSEEEDKNMNSKISNNLNQKNEDQEEHKWEQTVVQLHLVASLNDLKNNPERAKLSIASNENAFSKIEESSTKSKIAKKTGQSHFIVDEVEILQIEHTFPVALGFKISGMEYKAATKSFSSASKTDSFLYISTPREKSKVKDAVAKGASNGVHLEFLQEFPNANKTNIGEKVSKGPDGKTVFLSKDHPVASKYQDYYMEKHGVEKEPLEVTKRGQVEMSVKSFEKVKKYIEEDILTKQASLVDPKGLFLVLHRANPGEGKEEDGTAWIDTQELIPSAWDSKSNSVNDENMRQKLNTPYSLYVTVKLRHELH